MEPEGFGIAGQWLAALFCGDDGVLTSPHIARPQEALDFLADTFDRFGLRTNMAKIMGMTCQTCCMSG